MPTPKYLGLRKAYRVGKTEKKDGAKEKKKKSIKKKDAKEKVEE